MYQPKIEIQKKKKAKKKKIQKFGGLRMTGVCRC